MRQDYARSYLFVPANRPERFDKALAAGADAVIVDLEDAVSAADKEAARQALAEYLSPDKPVLVRINAADTPWFGDDLRLCRTPGVAGIVLPKAERSEDIGILEAAGAVDEICLLIETAQGIANVNALAQASGVRRLMFGSIDFKLDLGIEGDGEELNYFRSQLVLASRLAGLPPPVDGVCTAIDDPHALGEETRRARRFGFGAKLCIHPRQVAPVHENFMPNKEEVAWAERVLFAARSAAGAAVAVDGRMVDRPVILRAQQIAAMAGQPGPD